MTLTRVSDEHEFKRGRMARRVLLRVLQVDPPAKIEPTGLDKTTTRQETRQELDSYLTGYSTAARQLLDRIARQLLDRPRQTLTDLDRPPPDCMCLGVKLSSSTARQTLTDLDWLDTR